MGALNSLKDQLILKANNLKTLVTNKITQVKSMKNDGAFDRISETTGDNWLIIVVVFIVTIISLIYIYKKSANDTGGEKRNKKVLAFENCLYKMYDFKPVLRKENQPTMFSIMNMNFDIREDDYEGRLFLNEEYYCEPFEWSKHKDNYYILRDKLEDILRAEKRNDILLLEIINGSKTVLSEGSYVLKEEYEEVPIMESNALLRHGIII